MRNSQELHEIILSNISDAVFITDNSGQFTFICPNVGVIFGYSPQDAEQLGNIHHLLGENLFNEKQLEICGEIPNIEREITNKFGRKHLLLVNVKRVSINRGTVLYTCRDITEHKQAEAIIQQLNVQLEQRVRERTAELQRTNEALSQEIQERRRVETAFAESEEKFHSIFEQAAIGIGQVTLDGTWIVVNQRLADIVGYTREELLERTWQDITHPDDLEADQAYVGQLLAGEINRYSMQKRYIHKNGTLVWVQIHTTLLRKPSGEPKTLIGVIEDITERKQAEEALQDSQQQLTSIIANIPGGVYRAVYHADGRVTLPYLSPGYRQLMGIDPKEIMNNSQVDLSLYIHPDDLETFAAVVREHSQTLGSSTLEYRLISNNGQVRWIQDNARFSRNDRGDLIVDGVDIDISDRKLAQEALHQSQHFNETIANASPQLLYIFDLTTGCNDYVNQQITEMWGYTPQEVQQAGSQFFWNNFYPDDLHLLHGFSERFATLADGEVVETEYRIRHKNGSWRWMRSRDIVFSRSADGSPKQILGTAIDITDRKQAEEELQKYRNYLEELVQQRTEELLATNQQLQQEISERLQAESAIRFQVRLLELVNHAVIATDLTGTITYWNPFAEKLYGWSVTEVVGRNILDIAPAQTTQAQAAEIMSCLSSGEAWSGEFLVQRRDGTSFPAIVTDSPIHDEEGRLIGIVGISFDITERKQAEEALQKANAELGITVEERTRDLGSAIARLQQEIVKRNQAEDALRQSEARYRELAESISDVFFAMDKDWRYTYWNKASEKLTGLSAQDAIGKSIYEIFPDIKGTETERIYCQVIKTKKACSFVNSYQIKGKKLFFEINAYPSKGGISVFVKDITDRKQAEETLRQIAQKEQSLNRVIQAIRNSLDLTTIFDTAASEIGNLLRVEQVEITQYLPELHLWRHVAQYRQSLDLPDVLGREIPDQGNPIAAQLKQLNVIQIEDTNPISDELYQYVGEISPGACLLVPLQVGDAVWGSILLVMHRQRYTWQSWQIELIRAVAAQLAIAIQQANLYSQVQQSEERFRAVFEQAAVGITLSDYQSGQYLRVNQRFCQMLGYTESELLQRTWQDITHPDDLNTDLAHHARIEAGEKSFSMEKRYIRKDGTPQWVNLTISVVDDLVGTPNYAIKVVEDIQERKRAEEALKASEARFKALVQNSYDIITITDEQDNIVYRSPASERILGYPHSEMPYKRPVHRVHPDDLPQIAATMAALKAQPGVPITVEYRMQRVDGSWVWLESVATNWYADPTIRGIVSNTRDITERKQAESVLRQQMERERLLVQIAQHIRQSLNLDQILNTTVGEVRQLLQADRVLIFRLDPHKIGVVSHESVIPGLPTTVGHEYEDEEFPSDCYQNYCQGKVRIIADIEVDETASCLREYLQQLGVKSRLSVPILQRNTLWGLLIVHHCREHRNWQAWEVNLLGQLATQVAIAIQQAQLYRQLEAELHERKQAQAQLQQAAYAAEVANRAKSEFLANMSHELRTPLNAILGFTQLMSQERSLSSSQQEHLGIISRAGEHLLSLINDILSMSKIEAGQIALDENSFDLYRLLDTLEQMFQFKAANKSLQLLFERIPGVPQLVYSDESKLRSCLINLLDNAIKFTQSGGVALRVKMGDGESGKLYPPTPGVSSAALTPPESNGLYLYFEVEDTGSGIAPEEIDSLFEPFVQTQTGRKSHSGTGLGLAISRRFVQMMGGDITVSSVLGKGTIFKFNVRIKLAQTVEISPQPQKKRVIGIAPGQPRYRILVVEDNSHNRQLLLNLLKPLGFDLREAENGQEGVTLWESWQPHLIWMDMRMPVMDGYEATKQIRAKQRGREGENSICGLLSPIPNQSSKIQNPQAQATVIIAITASAFEEEREGFLAAGCDDFVIKPFQKEVIFEKMAQHLEMSYVYEESTPSANREIETISPAYPLTTSDLAVMPADWVAQLHQAAMSLDADLMNQLIAQIPESHAALAIALANLIDEFRFDKIMDLTPSSFHE